MKINKDLHKGEVQFHLKIKKGDVSRYVLTPGNPDRVDLIGEYWDQYRKVQHNREFKIGRGKYKDVDISACSTGIGGPSTDIAIIELNNAGADTFLRVGTCAALQENIEVNDLIINTGALRLNSTTDSYIGKEFPAIASYELVMALIEAADKLGYQYHLGLTATVDSFYAGEDNPMPNGYRPSHLKDLVDDLHQAGVTNFEMEASTIFVLSNLFGLRGGCVCSVAANRITGMRAEKPDIKKVCKTANEAIRILKKWDKLKTDKNKKYFFPGLSN